jgi:NADH-quinone oxidoreductase subunit N
MPVTFQDLLATAPITIAACTALLIVLVDALIARSEDASCWLAIAGLVASLVAGLAMTGAPGLAYTGMVVTGGSAGFFAAVFSGAGALSVMLARPYLRRQELVHGEFYALVVFAVAGMMMMAAAADLIVFFLGLELMSICFYVLAGFARTRPTSNEAALKYFLLGSFATGFLLYGIALVYGSTGTTNIQAIAAGAPALATSPLFLTGLGLLLVGLVFKVAAVPFHMWVPDVYEGAPTPVSGFMSTGGKAAAFAAFLILFAPRLLNIVGPVREVLAVIAALSMVAGNVIALAQTNVKRMLAYSSIAHAGYLLTGVIAANAMGGNGVLFYLAAYTAMNIGAFGVIGLLETPEGGLLTFDEYAGMSRRRPLLAGLMAVFMFSLAGVPPFAGFFGKYYVFAGAVAAGYTWLAILGVLMSVVSAYYYLRLVVLMYFREQEGGETAGVPVLGTAALVLSAIFLVGCGLFPSTVLDLTSHFF